MDSAVLHGLVVIMGILAGVGALLAVLTWMEPAAEEENASVSAHRPIALVKNGAAAPQRSDRSA